MIAIVSKTPRFRCSVRLRFGDTFRTLICASLVDIFCLSRLTPRPYPPLQQLTYTLSTVVQASNLPVGLCYFTLFPTNDFKSQDNIEDFTITMPALSQSLFVYTYCYRSTAGITANLKITGPQTNPGGFSTAFSVSPVSWSYQLLKTGQADVGASSVSGRVGDSFTVLFTLASNVTDPTSAGVPALLASSTAPAWNALGTVTPRAFSIPGTFFDQVNLTFTLQTPSFPTTFPFTSSLATFAPVNGWAYSISGTPFTVTITDVLLPVVVHVVTNGVETTSTSVSGTPGSVFELAVYLGKPAPIGGLTLSIAPLSPAGRNAIFPTSIFFPAGTGELFNTSVRFNITLVNPTTAATAVSYGVSFTEAGFLPVTTPAPFTVTTTQKSVTSSATNSVPLLNIVLQAQGIISPPMTAANLNALSTFAFYPKDNFTLTVVPTGVPFASQNLNFQLVIVPLLYSLDPTSAAAAYTITSASTQPMQAGSNAPLTFTFSLNVPDSYNVYVVNAEGEYATFLAKFTANRLQCSNSVNVALADTPNLPPQSITLSFGGEDPFVDGMEITLNAIDLARVAPYVTFLNTTVPYLSNGATFWYQWAGTYATSGCATERVRWSSTEMVGFDPVVCFLTVTPPAPYTFSASATPYATIYPTTGGLLANGGARVSTPGTVLVYAVSASLPAYIPATLFSVSMYGSARFTLLNTTLVLSNTVATSYLYVQFNGFTDNLYQTCESNNLATNTIVIVPAANASYIADAVSFTPVLSTAASIVLGRARYIGASGTLVPYAQLTQTDCGQSASVATVSVGTPITYYLRAVPELASTSTTYTIEQTMTETSTPNLGTWDRMSITVDNTNYDSEGYSFTFTAASVGAATFVVRDTMSRVLPFYFQIVVSPTSRSITSSGLPTSTLYAGQMRTTTLTFSAISDMDMRFLFNVTGTGNVSIVYPPLDSEGFLVVPRLLTTMPIVWRYNTPGNFYVSLQPEVLSSFEPSSWILYSSGYVQFSDFYLVPSYLPGLRVGQEVEILVKQRGLTPLDGRNVTSEYQIASNWIADGSALQGNGYGHIRIGQRTIRMSADDSEASFKIKAMRAGIAGLLLAPTSTVSGLSTIGLAAYIGTPKFGISSSDVANNNRNGMYVMSDSGPNTVTVFISVPQEFSYGQVIDFVEWPLFFTVNVTGPAGGWVLPTSNSYYVSGITGDMSFDVNIALPGDYSVNVEFAPLRLGAGKKKTQWQQFLLRTLNFTAVLPVQFMNSAGTVQTGIISNSVNAGSWFQMLAYQPNPRSDFTLKPFVYRAQYGANVSISATNSVTGATVADVFSAGLSFRAGSLDYWLVRFTGVSPTQGPTGQVTIRWNSSETAFGSSYAGITLTNVITVNQPTAATLVTPGLSSLAGRNVRVSQVSAATFTLSAPVNVATSFVLTLVSGDAVADLSGGAVVTFPATATSTVLVVGVAAYGRGQYVLVPADEATSAVAFGSSAFGLQFGDAISVSGWPTYIRSDSVYSVLFTRSTTFFDLGAEAVVFNVNTPDSTIEDQEDREWDLVVLKEGTLDEQADNNTITIPAGAASTVARFTVRQTSSRVTYAQVSFQTAGFYFYNDLRMVTQKTIQLYYEPVLPKNGSVAEAWFHCPSEWVGSESFSLFTDGDLYVMPTTFTCSSGVTAVPVLVWGKPNTLYIAPNSKRGSYDPTGKLNDSRVLVYKNFGSGTRLTAPQTNSLSAVPDA